MNAKSFLLMVPLAALSCLAAAQSDKVLRGQEITESALIQALTPPASAAEEPIRTRSIRVNRDDAPRPAAAKPAKPASASLLITFETNSAELTPRAKQSLDVVGQALSSDKLADFRFAIQGHADPRGDSEANLRLSQMRAESVRQYLVQNNRIEDRRLEAIGKGDKELLNPANPIAPENRRVTIVNLAQ
ncbi:MAG: OmpA family protein [Herminiimonas sp.]|nr:OmpA family protein [Herminiimonas sp.]